MKNLTTNEKAKIEKEIAEAYDTLGKALSAINEARQRLQEIGDIIYPETK